jgi:hypothetical protein
LYIAIATPAVMNTSCSIVRVVADELDRQSVLAGKAEVGGFVLVTKGVTAGDRLGPASAAGTFFADDRLAEDDAAMAPVIVPLGCATSFRLQNSSRAARLGRWPHFHANADFGDFVAASMVI